MSGAAPALDSALLAGPADHELSSVFSTCVNIVCAVIGAGILALPKGLASSGWSGMILLAVVTYLSTYCADIIIKCIKYRGDGRFSQASRASRLLQSSEAGDAKALPRQNSGVRHTYDSYARSASRPSSQYSFADHVEQALSTYGDIGEAAFPRWGRRVVNICAHLTLIGPCIGYLVLAGSNLSLLVCDYISTPLAIALCTAVLWPHVWLPTLTEVAVLSAFNVLVAAWLIVVVIVEAVRSDPHAAASIIAANATDPSSCAAQASNLDTTFLNMGLEWWYAFPAFATSFACHPVLPSVYEEMREKEKYSKVVWFVFPMIGVIYATLGVVGYQEYGSCVQAPIYWNVAPGIGRLSAIVLISVHVLLTFCIVGFASEKAMGDWLLDIAEARMERRASEGEDSAKTQLSPGQTKLIMVAGKTLVVAMCCAFACIVPDFEGVFGLVGSLPVAMSTFILPCTFNIKLYGDEMSTASKLGNGATILFGVLGAVFGTIASVIGIVKFFTEKQDPISYPTYCPDPTKGGW